MMIKCEHSDERQAILQLLGKLVSERIYSQKEMTYLDFWKLHYFFGTGIWINVLLCCRMVTGAPPSTICLVFVFCLTVLKVTYLQSHIHRQYKIHKLKICNFLLNGFILFNWTEWSIVVYMLDYIIQPRLSDLNATTDLWNQVFGLLMTV